MTNSSAQERDTGVVALVGGTIIDGNGDAPINDGVLVIERRRISAVGDRSTPIPAHAKQILVRGKFLTPGLMNTQSLLVNYGWPPAIAEYEGRFHEMAIEAAQIALKAGITTVFDALGPRDALIRARDAINEGGVSGARIYLCGNWIGNGGPFSPDLLDHSKEDVGDDSLKRTIGPVISALEPDFRTRINALWETNVGRSLMGVPLEEARLEVRKHAESGIDYVTFPVNSHRFGMYSQFALSPRVQRMIVEEAHRAGLPALAIFAFGEEGAHLALDAAPDSFALSGRSPRPVSTSVLERIARSGIFVQIAVVPDHVMEWFRRAPPSLLYPGFLETTETKARDDRAMISAGVQIVSTGGGCLLHPEQRKRLSGAGTPGMEPELGVSLLANLHSLQDAGVKPMHALMAATRNVARAYKLDKDLGTLERGKLADVLILDGNPLENPKNYHEVHLVIKDGNVVDRDALPTYRLLTAPSAETI